jgi:hypothetical protein
MKRTLLLLVIIISCCGCKKDDSYKYSSSLTGTWTWLQTCGGIIGCVGPEEEHITAGIVLKADSTYEDYLNDTLSMSGRYYTSRLISTDRKDTSDIIIFESGSQFRYLIIHDTLALSNAFLGSLYKRTR